MSVVDVPAGMRYDEARQFLLVTGVVARQMATHPLAPRPKRDSRAAAFDELAGNTTLGIHMSEIAAGGFKRGHRHVDEAVMYIVTGRGYSEMRQSDEKEDQRVDWKAGDLVSIPANAWHKHYNLDPDNPCRQLAFKNTRLLRRLFGSRDFVYANDFRFHDRYDDEDDYWEVKEPLADGRVRTNIIAACVDQPLPNDPNAGEGVSQQRYTMGGHLMLNVALVEIAPGGHFRAHKRLAEEALFVLSGSGRTHMWTEGGREETVRWRAGDLISPPFNVWRQHVAEGDEPARFLLVSNDFVERALGIDGGNLDTVLPDRFPAVAEPGQNGR